MSSASSPATSTSTRCGSIQSDISGVIDSLLDSPERAGLLGELTADPSIRRSSEVLSQFEVLAPNNPAAYTRRFAEATRKRDVEAAAAVVERARRAKAIDVSETAAARSRWLAGTEDTKYLASFETARARLDAALAAHGLESRGPAPPAST